MTLLDSIKKEIGKKEKLSFNKLLKITTEKKQKEKANFLANKETLLKEVFHL